MKLTKTAIRNALRGARCYGRYGYHNPECHKIPDDIDRYGYVSAVIADFNDESGNVRIFLYEIGDAMEKRHYCLDAGCADITHIIARYVRDTAEAYGIDALKRGCKTNAINEIYNAILANYNPRI